MRHRSGSLVLNEVKNEHSYQHEMSEILSQSYSYCHQITRQRARNFYYGLKLTPQPKRSAIYVIYAFMRACDDLADECSPDQQQPQRIERFRAMMQQICEQPQYSMEAVEDFSPEHALLWPAFHHVVHTYQIQPQYFHAMLDGQLDDLTRQRYHTFDELRQYCYKVASVVGLVCISIWGYEGGRTAEEMAECRGVALQLTNILRDLKEDAQRGRIYLPLDELAKFGYSEDNLLAGQVNGEFDRFMQFQTQRARDYYRRSESLENYIDTNCRSTSWAMMRIYRSLLEQIAKNPRRVFHKRVRLSSASKIGIALHASLKRTW